MSEDSIFEPKRGLDKEYINLGEIIHELLDNGETKEIIREYVEHTFSQSDEMLEIDLKRLEEKDNE